MTSSRIVLNMEKRKIPTGESGERICFFLKNEIQLYATYYFIVLLIGPTCFGHYYSHHQELATIMLITTFVVPCLVCCRLEISCG